MSKAVSLCLILISSFLFTGCESGPHVYNPNANYGNNEPAINSPIGGAPLIEDGKEWDTVTVGPNGATKIPGDDRGTPVTHPYTSPVFFAYDSAVVGKAYDDMLQSIATYLNDNKNYHLTVTGHCDERGSEEYNRALSERRALAVKEAVIGYGAPADRVNTVGYGEERPAAPGTNAEAYAKNRRAEFEVFSK